MTRAEIWVRFATGAAANPQISHSYGGVARCADLLLAEFDKRFEPLPNPQDYMAYPPETFVERKS